MMVKQLQALTAAYWLFHRPVCPNVNVAVLELASLLHRSHVLVPGEEAAGRMLLNVALSSAGGQWNEYWEAA